MHIQPTLHKALLALHVTFLTLAIPAFGATVAGSTPGEFTVSSGGSANYRIPIQTPPGVAGIQPKLNLAYDSQQDNGALGVGWSLSGLSSISRCAKTRTADGVSASVGYVLSDRYCINGQRLMLVSGTHGVAGAQYRTEREGFSNITAYGSSGNGPAYFIERTKAGLTIEYGNTADSRIEAQGQATPRTWAQNKVSDAKGNYLTVAYLEDTTNGSYYPSRIDYTGNASSTPVLTPSASVQITYTTRPDSETSYQAGSMIKSNQRISNVKSFNGSTVVKDYQLTYEQSTHTNRSRLKTVTECDGAGNCLAPVAMNWPNVANTMIEPTAPSIPESGYGTAGGYISHSLDPNFTQVGDFNGDGKMDFLFGGDANGWWIAYGTDTGFTSPVQVLAATVNGYSTIPTDRYYDPSIPVLVLSARPYIFFGDFNGDGKLDMMWRPADGGWMVAYGTTTGFTQPTAPSIPETGYGTAGGYISHSLNPNFMQVGDFNGDGKMDFLFGGDANGWWIAYGTDTGFTSPVQLLAATVNGYSTIPTDRYYDPSIPVLVLSARPYIFFGDFNGDGKLDMMWRPADGGWMVAYGTTTGFTQPTAPSIPESGYGTAGGYISHSLDPNFTQVGDFNGDGKMDFLFGGDANGWWIAYGTDTGFTSPVQVLAATVNGISTIPTDRYFDLSVPVALLTARPYIFFGDFNGDGKLDMMWRPVDGGWFVAYGNGTGFTQPTAPAIPDGGYGPAGGYNSRALNPNFMQIGDFNGDGKADYLFGGDGNGWWIAYGTDTGFASPVQEFASTVNGNSTIPTDRYFDPSMPVLVLSARPYILFGDYNGDGKLDMMWRPTAGGWFLATPFRGNDAISSISGASTADVAITYKPISDPSVYTKDSTAVFPVQDMIGPFHVVSSVASNNGVGGVNTTNYTYGGLKVELNTGVGLLGFRWIKSQDTTTQLEGYTEFRQDWPFSGMVSKSETRLAGAGNAGVLKRSTPTLACKIPQTGTACVVAQRCDQSANSAACAASGAARYFTYAASSLDESWDLNGAAWPSVTSATTYGVDSADNHLYGDPGQTTVTSSDGSSKTTVYEYWPADTSNWILGRLKKSTVTSTTP